MVQEIRENSAIEKSLYRSWRNEIHWAILFCISLLAATYALLKGLGFIPFLAPLTCLAILLHRLVDVRYHIDPQTIVAEEGKLSLIKNTSQVLMKDVRGIDVEQSIFQQVVGTGDVKVGTSAMSDAEIVIEGVDNPQKQRQTIVSATAKASPQDPRD